MTGTRAERRAARIQAHTAIATAAHAAIKAHGAGTNLAAAYAEIAASHEATVLRLQAKAAATPVASAPEAPAPAKARKPRAQAQAASAQAA